MISGTLFGLVAVAHLLRLIQERSLLSTDPGYFLGIAGLGLLGAFLAIWAWRLLNVHTRP